MNILKRQNQDIHILIKQLDRQQHTINGLNEFNNDLQKENIELRKERAELLVANGNLKRELDELKGPEKEKKPSLFTKTSS